MPLYEHQRANALETHAAHSQIEFDGGGCMLHRLKIPQHGGRLKERSLNVRHANEIVTACAQILDGWSLAQHEGYDGTLTLVLIEDDLETCFVFDGASGGITLSAMSDDRLTDCATFETMREAIAAVVTLIRSPAKVRYLS